MLDVVASRITVSPSVHARRFAEELVILDLERGEYFSAGDVAASIWDGIVDGTPFDAIVTRIASDYDVDRERAMADAIAFVTELRERGLVVLEERA